MVMKSYNISKLKSFLSSVLEEVVSGQEILVTDHNRPIAKLVPLRRMGRLPRGNLKALLEWTPLPLKKGTPSSTELMRQIRDEEVH